MKYSELRDMFMSLLNKNDCTIELADRFIELGTGRVERTLRTALQRKLVEVVRTPDGDFPIPSDLMSFVRVSDDKGTIPHVSHSNAGRGYYVKINTIELTHDADTITVQYYAEFPRTVVDDYSPQASVISDVIIYSSLVYAAIHFIDERRPVFEEFYKTLNAEVQALSNELDMSGHPVIRNPYEGYI